MHKLTAQAPCLHPGAVTENSEFGAYCEVGEHARILNSSFGDYAYCERYCDIANTSVGKFANIAAQCRIGPTDHPFANAAQHHFLYRSSRYWDDVADDAEFFAARAARRSSLGADCWIGHGAIIKPEVKVGIGAIVASGAVVTKDVPDFAIVGGVSAGLIRMRFLQTVIDRLLALAWWDWDHARLRQALPDFRSLSAEGFLEKYNG